MGKVNFNGTEIGTFSPQTVGASGVTHYGTVEVGIFNFSTASGVVHFNGGNIGTYSGLGGVTPSYAKVIGLRAFDQDVVPLKGIA